jgi:Flp pilus assembly pilin Flp
MRRRTAKTSLLAMMEAGQDAVEYALLLAIIALAIIAGATVLGQAISALFQALGAFLMTLP